MSEIIREFATEAIAAILGALILVFQRWKAKRDFEQAAGQNQALRDIQAAQGVTPSAPPAPRAKRGTGSLFPRAPTPLPFWPVNHAPKGGDAEAVPEPVGLERSDPTGNKG